jgi:hypothetical protein
VESSGLAYEIKYQSAACDVAGFLITITNLDVNAIINTTKYF